MASDPPPLDVDVVVVGGGLSGLTAAYRLQQRGHRVTVLESTARTGGVIGTRRRDGALFETGPNSTLDNTAQIGALLEDLGIRDERCEVRSVTSTRFVVRDGRLIPLPSSPQAFFATPAFRLRAKLRVLAEPFIAPSPANVEESVAAFARRRLGAEIYDYAIDPFVSGVYAGDPELLSVAAAFPRLVALERTHGSLLKGQIRGVSERKRSGATAKGAGASFSFNNGMQTLTDALARKLLRVELGVDIERVTRNADGTWTVEGMRERTPMMRRARAVILSVPASAAVSMIAALSSDAANALMQFNYAPVAITASAYRRTDVEHSLAGFGFLVPSKERRAILGSLFSSSMFDGRAPPGIVLLTTFAGGARNPAVVALPDAEIGATAHRELASLLAITGAPLWQEVIRWPRAIPQYNLGHLTRIAKIDEAEAGMPGLRFCASYRGGVSVGDCIKSAQATAEHLDRYLATTGYVGG